MLFFKTIVFVLSLNGNLFLCIVLFLLILLSCLINLNHDMYIILDFLYKNYLI